VSTCWASTLLFHIGAFGDPRDPFFLEVSKVNVCFDEPGPVEFLMRCFPSPEPVPFWKSSLRRTVTDLDLSGLLIAPNVESLVLITFFWGHAAFLLMGRRLLFVRIRFLPSESESSVLRRADSPFSYCENPSAPPGTFNPSPSGPPPQTPLTFQVATGKG